VKEKLRQLLDQRQKKRIFDASRVSSAVLLPLYYRQGQLHLLFIKRTETVREHKGEISFPGGTREKGETALDTALRECCEEIDLHAEDVEVLGELDDYVTITSNYIVTPFVGMIPWPYQFTMHQDEVDEIIEVPISALLEDSCLHGDPQIIEGKEVEYYAYHYQGRVIWGATARILHSFLNIYAQTIQRR
jgi:8-oxo-dGTP pyrophosphatase MutT (NUDIX family)